MAKVYDTATDLITFARLQSQNTTSGSSYLGSDGLLKFAAEDEPRIEYGSDGTLKGLLIEEQRTNLVTYSEDFSQSYWLKQAGGTGSTPVVAASSLTDPAGGTGAYQVELDAGSGTTLSDQSKLSAIVTSTQGADYTHSIWVRGDAGGEQINIRGARQGAYQLVTLTTDWQRVTGTEAAFSTQSPIEIVIRQSANGVINSTATIHVYGAQIEKGSFATSYIPTSGSQQTRSADLASIPVSAFGFNASAGSLLVQCQHFTTETGATAAAAVALDDGSSNNRMWYYQNKGQWIGSSGGVTQFSISGGDLAEDTEVKAGMVYSRDDFALYVDGSSVGADTSGSIAEAVTTLHVGKAGGTTVPLNGHIKSIQYYPRRLTDDQLVELTS